MVRAASSLPEPGAPVTRMRALVGAARSIVWRSWLTASECADDPARLHGAGAQVLDLALEARGFERALGDEHQPVGLERLLDEVVGAGLDRRDGRLDVAVARDHHHRQVGMLRLDEIEHLQAVEPAALEPDVEEDEMRAPRPRSRRAPRRRCRRCGCGGPRPRGCPPRARGCRPRRRRSGCRRSCACPAIGSAAGCASLVAARAAPVFGIHMPDAARPVPAGLSASSMPPPCSSRIFATIGKAEPGAALAGRHVGLEQALAALRPESPCRCR